MKKVLFFLLLFSAAFTLTADMLDQMSTQLDTIERGFWLSLRQQKGEYREYAMDTLSRFAASASQIQNFLVLRGIKKYRELSGSARMLQQIYMNAKFITVRRFSFNFKKTTFRDYQGEFNRLQREKAAEEAEQQEEGGKKKKKTRRATVRPNLKNVDLIEYERWLAEVTAANQEKFIKMKNNGSSSEVKKMQDFANDYLTCIRQLRLVLAKIRQETKFEFKAGK